MNKDSYNIDMLHGSIAIKMILMAVPIMISALLQLLFNTTDMIVVGRFAGSNSLAAVGANTPVINLMVSIYTGLSIGSNVMASRLIGEKDEASANKVVSTSIMLSLFCGLIFTLIGLSFAKPILKLMNTPMEVIDDASLYFKIYFLGMPFYMLYNFCVALLSSKGDTRRPLYVLASFGVVNLFLNLVLVINYNMGVAGVAIATLVSSSASALVILYMLTKETGYLHFNIRRPRINMVSLKGIVKIGIPTSLQGAVFSLSNIIIQGGVNSLGTDAIAATTTSLTFDFLSYYILMGFSQAGMSFLSQNYGAMNTKNTAYESEERERCRKIIWQTLLLGVGSVMVVSFICVLLRYELSGIYTTYTHVIEFSAMRTLLVLPFYFIHSINEILSALLRALGYSMTPALICIVGICVTRVAWVATVFQSHHTYNVLNACYPISWIVTALVMGPVAFIILRRTILSKQKIPSPIEFLRRHRKLLIAKISH